jgi:hypothetical protein
MRNPLASWPEFAAAVEARLEQGRREYRDCSFSLAPAELVREIEEELLDVCAWSFIAWSRLRRLGLHRSVIEPGSRKRSASGRGRR